MKTARGRVRTSWHYAPATITMEVCFTGISKDSLFKLAIQLVPAKEAIPFGVENLKMNLKTIWNTLIVVWSRWQTRVQIQIKANFSLHTPHNHIWTSNTHCLVRSIAIFNVFLLKICVYANNNLFYFVSGRIIDGFDALDELEKLQVNPKSYKPLVEKRINSVTIHANPLAG